MLCLHSALEFFRARLVLKITTLPRALKHQRMENEFNTVVNDNNTNINSNNINNNNNVSETFR